MIEINNGNSPRAFRAVSVQNERPFEKSLAALSDLSADQLKEIRYNLGQFLHSSFLQAVGQGFKGLVICDPLCAGKTGDALATNDGSSKYIRGALCSTNRESANSNSQSVIGTLEKFLTATTTLDMKVDLVLGIAKEEGKYKTFVYEKGKAASSPEAMLELPDKAKQGSEAYKELASLAMLLTAGKWLARESNNPDLIGQLENCMQRPAMSPTPLMQEAFKIQATCSEAWNELAGIVKGLPPVVVGESFTFGKLANLLSSHETVKPLQTAYGWYDANYKVAVGVGQNLVTEALIAEPVTVTAGAKGLIKTLGSPESLSLATSGWSNFWKKGEADYFSVAISGNLNGAEYNDAKRFTVGSTITQPLEKGRREITRELGVAVALSLLASYLEKANPGKAESIATTRAKLDSLISLYGTYS